MGILGITQIFRAGVMSQWVTWCYTAGEESLRLYYGWLMLSCVVHLWNTPHWNGLLIQNCTCCVQLLRTTQVLSKIVAWSEVHQNDLLGEVRYSCHIRHGDVPPVDLILIGWCLRVFSELHQGPLWIIVLSWWVWVVFAFHCDRVCGPVGGGC